MTISARTPAGFSRKQCLSTKPSLTDSPQTDLESASPASDELDIKTTAKEVVSQLPSGIRIIDMGASGSMKFEPYVREFRVREKSALTCLLTFPRAPIDLNHEFVMKKNSAMLRELWGNCSCRSFHH